MVKPRGSFALEEKKVCQLPLVEDPAEETAELDDWRLNARRKQIDSEKSDQTVGLFAVDIIYETTL